ncbi:MAG: hypothetical protein ACOCWQ_04360 [Nanoarchaeota archaeon]
MRTSAMQSVYHLLIFLVILCIFSIGSMAVSADASLSLHATNQSVLSDQQLYAISCMEDATEITHLLLCLDNFNSRTLNVNIWNESCYVSYVDLAEFDCNRASVQATYKQDGEPKKQIVSFPISKVQVDPRKILAGQEWDGGWDTPSDTAYSIWILSHYPARFSSQISQGLDWLKVQRDDDAKCWALSQRDGQCSVFETARTLAFLTLAGVNSSNRVYADAITWLEEQQNYLDAKYDDRWTLRVETSADAICRVVYDGSTLYDDVINDTYKDFEIAPKYSGLVNVSCNGSNARITLIDGNDLNVFSREFDDEDDDYDYTIKANEEASGDRYRIPPSCWSALRPWTYCNKEVTMYALIADVDEEQKQEAGKWLHSVLNNDSVTGRFLSTRNDIFDSAMYLYAIDADDEDVLDWLVYRQNNDGSWGKGDVQQRVAPTVMSILALQNQTFSSSTEVLRDARHWISINTPADGWEELKDDALSFLILRENARPFLRYQGPSPLFFKTATEITLINPTHFDIDNITYSVAGGMGEIVAAEGPSQVQAYRNMTVRLSQAGQKAGDFRGELQVMQGSNNSRMLLRIPMLYTQDATLDFVVPDTVHAFLQSGEMEVTVRSVNADFSCDIDWDSDDISTPGFHLAKKGTVNVPLRLMRNDSGVFSGAAVCTKGDLTVIRPVQVEVVKHRVQPFSVEQKHLSFRRPGQNRSVIIRNNLDIPLDVAVDFQEEQYSFVLDANVLAIEPDGEAELKVINQVLEGENITMENAIVFSAFDQKETVPVRASIIYRPGLAKKIIVWVILLAVLGGLGYGIYYGITNREELEEKVKSGMNNMRSHLPASIQKMLPKTADQIAEERSKAERQNQERNYYEEIVSIMKAMDKSDEDITNRLNQEGLTESQISQVLDDYEKSQKIQQNIKHEEDVLGLLKDIGDQSSDVFKKLKDHGYSDTQINESISELAKEIEEKEREIKKDAGLLEDEDEPGEQSLTDLARLKKE